VSAPLPVAALIFDMDGVLIDSHPVHRQAWNRLIRSYGATVTEAMHERMHGKHNDEIVRCFFGGDLTKEEVVARGKAKEALYRDLAAPLVPGIREFLERYYYLQKAVATNAEAENLHFVLERAGLARHFSATVDVDEVERPKPHPDIYLRASRLLGVPPEACVVFEDSHSGVAAALRAGMRVIGIATTHVNLPGTCLTIDNFVSRDLKSWLEAQRQSG